MEQKILNKINYSLLALGSNLGDREQQLLLAQKLIAQKHQIVAVSDFYFNPAAEGAGSEEFINMVLLIRTSSQASELIDDLFSIESQIDPERDTRGRKLARKIDLDILLYNDEKIQEENLIIPHPRMAIRDFVMLPIENLLSKLDLNYSEKTIVKLAKSMLETFKEQQLKNLRQQLFKTINAFSCGIKQMTLSDLDDVCNLDPKIFGKVHWTRNIFTNELNNPNALYYTASKQGKVVGYIGAWIVIDELHILTLGVDPDQRRQKIAEHMLLTMIDSGYENNIRAITLEVRESNEAAQKLYAKYGFKSHGLRKNYYEDNKESAVLLWTPDIDSATYIKKLSSTLIQPALKN